ncbi:MAG: MFS transporter [Polyangiaceae bacterium]|jgi:MFS family permease|nr:MFS transporter [Polyangiaceae bacterium]MBK8938523.1 MFS transporter [Polyangiaceae bacterium]
MASPSFRGLPASFWRLWLATLVNRLGGFVVPFLSLYLGAERQVAASTTGVVVACFGVGSMLAGPFGGALADRVGRKVTVVLGMGLSAVAMMALTQPTSPVGLAVACFFLGVATELPRPATSALVADLVPEADRPRAYGALYWAANLGFAAAGLLAGLVSSVSFFVLFAVDAATCLACAAIVALGVPETRGAAARASRPFSVSDLARPFRDPAFVRFFAASLAVALVFFQFHVAMPLDMRAHGVTTSEYGVLVALNGVLVVTLQPLAPRLFGRMSNGAALATAAVLNGAGFGLLGLVDGFWGYTVAIATFTLGEVLMAPVNPTVVASLAPPSLRATYQGAYLLSYSIASAASPVVGGALLSSVGGPVLWGGCFVLGLVGAALHLAAVGSRQRNAAPVVA